MSEINKKYKDLPILGKRFLNDGKEVVPLNKFQLRYKKQIEDKIKKGVYEFEKINCVICDSKEFEILSEKDRYGLYMPVTVCISCGLVQTNPRMKEYNYNEFYEKEYRNLYDGQSTPTEIFFENQYEHGKRINDFIKSVIGNDVKNKFVVEIGASAGGALKFFKDLGNDVLGFDLDSNHIKFGRNKNIDLKIGTVKNLSDIPRKPDLVIYSHVLEHVNNPVQELQILKKFLHDSSMLYIELPGVNYLNNSYDQDFLKYLQNAHLYHFNLSSLINCASISGFELIEGDESIKSLFKTGEVKREIKNIYKHTLNDLILIEKQRKRISYKKIKKKSLIVASNLCDLSGVGKFIKPIYKKFLK